MTEMKLIHVIFFVSKITIFAKKVLNKVHEWKTKAFAPKRVCSTTSPWSQWIMTLWQRVHLVEYENWNNVRFGRDVISTLRQSHDAVTRLWFVMTLFQFSYLINRTCVRFGRDFVSTSHTLCVSAGIAHASMLGCFI